MSLLDDPNYLPFKLDLDRQRLLLLQLSAQQRSAAAFLDERALPAQPQAVWVPLSLLAGVAPALHVAAPDFIFHIGHCGSTLLSRLLQAWPVCQVLREPLPLRTLAAAAEDGNLSPEEGMALLQQLVALWGRPPAATAVTRTVIKATSSCNALIGPLLASGGGRVVLLDLPLAAYLATLFKAETSISDALAAEPGRRRYVASRLDADAFSFDAGNVPERCALGWLAERLRFQTLAQGEHAARILRIDFEHLLAQPASVLAQVAAHLQLPQDGLAAALASPAWSRYSKADHYAYDAADRQYDLALSGRRYAIEIAAGTQWLEAVLCQHPQLRDAML